MCWEKMWKCTSCFLAFIKAYIWRTIVSIWNQSHNSLQLRLCWKMSIPNFSYMVERHSACFLALQKFDCQWQKVVNKTCSIERWCSDFFFFFLFFPLFSIFVLHPKSQSSITSKHPTWMLLPTYWKNIVTHFYP